MTVERLNVRRGSTWAAMEAHRNDAWADRRADRLVSLLKRAAVDLEEWQVEHLANEGMRAPETDALLEEIYAEVGETS